MPAMTRSQQPDASLATMSPNLLWGLLEVADRNRVPTAGWVDGLNLDRRQLEDPAIRITTRQVATVIQRALPDLPPTVGLDLGEHQTVGNFALLGLAMTTAATLWDAIAIGIRYTPVVGGLMRFVEGASNDPGVFALRAEMTLQAKDIHRFVCEEFFSSCLALARSLVGPGLRARRIDFSYPAPHYMDRYRDVFGCPLAFDQPQDRLLLDRHWLEAPLPTHNPIAARHVLGLLSAQMPSQAKGEVTANVERLLRAQLDCNPHMPDIAAQLHVSERTLRRQLAVEGSSFRVLLDAIRIDQANVLLRNRSLSIYQVGTAVGYRDPREFRRAFKRLTGTTPRAARGRVLTTD